MYSTSNVTQQTGMVVLLVHRHDARVLSRPFRSFLLTEFVEFGRSSAEERRAAVGSERDGAWSGDATRLRRHCVFRLHVRIAHEVGDARQQRAESNKTKQCFHNM